MIAWIAAAFAEDLASARELRAYTTAVAGGEPSAVVLALRGDVDAWQGLWKSYEVIVEALPAGGDPAAHVRGAVSRIGTGCGIAAVETGGGFVVTRVGTCEGREIPWDAATVEDPFPKPAPAPEPVPVPAPAPPPVPAAVAAVGETGTVTADRLITGEHNGVLGLSSDALQHATIEGLALAGLDALGVTDGQLVLRDVNRARFEIDGFVEDARVRFAGGGGRAEVTLRWELRDREVEAVTYVGRTRGFVDQPSASRDRLVIGAVQAAVRSLAERQGFLEAIADSRPRDLSEPDWSARVDVARCPMPAVTLPSELASVLPAVVVVQTGSGAVGTGTFISPGGFLLTADHVVADEDEIVVRLDSGIELAARVLRADAYQDVAMLVVDGGGGFPCVGIGGLPSPGHDLFAVGNPFGSALEFSVSRGIVSGLRSVEGYRFIQTDASINAGYSGGPLLDSAGRLTGITTFKLKGDGLEGLGFGVPVEVALHRLGVDLADRTTEDLSGLDGRIARVETKTARFDDPTDLPDSAFGGAGSRSQRTARTALRVSGAAGLAVGGAAILGSWATSRDDTQYAVNWYGAVGVNTLGWVFALGGAGTLLSAQLVDGQPQMGVRGRF